MTALKSISATFLTMIVIYTIIVVANDGFDLFTPYLSDIFALNWSGQFNLDFGMYLFMPALWIAWRHEFSGKGVALAAIALIGGMLFFAAYLLVQIRKADGDGGRLLLGDKRLRPNLTRPETALN